MEKQKKDRFQMAKNVRVLIVEDHDMARMGLSVVLGNNERIEVVGMSADGQDGVDKNARFYFKWTTFRVQL